MAQVAQLLSASQTQGGHAYSEVPMQPRRISTSSGGVVTPSNTGLGVLVDRTH